MCKAKCEGHNEITSADAETIKREAWETKLEKVIRKNYFCKVK